MLLDNDPSVPMVPKDLQVGFRMDAGPGADTVMLTSPFSTDRQDDTCVFDFETPAPPQRCHTVALLGGGPDLLDFAGAHGRVRADLQSGKVTYAGGTAQVHGFGTALSWPGRAPARLHG
jgi:hypothetical protein